MYFCTKVDQSGSGDWPKGNYCIMRKGYPCPEGRCPYNVNELQSGFSCLRALKIIIFINAYRVHSYKVTQTCPYETLIFHSLKAQSYPCHNNAQTCHQLFCNYLLSATQL